MVVSTEINWLPKSCFDMVEGMVNLLSEAPFVQHCYSENYSFILGRMKKQIYF